MYGDPGSSSRDHTLNKTTDSEGGCDAQELVVVDTVVTQEDMPAWLQCDSISDLPTCQAIPNEAIVQDAANKL